MDHEFRWYFRHRVVGDVSLPPGELGIVLQSSEVLLTPGAKVVYAQDSTASGEQCFAEVRSEEPGSSGDHHPVELPVHCVPLLQELPVRFELPGAVADQTVRVGRGEPGYPRSG